MHYFETRPSFLMACHSNDKIKGNQILGHSLKTATNTIDVPIDKKRRHVIEGVCRAGPLGFRTVTTSGLTTVWASLAEADSALGVVASGFFLRSRLWYNRGCSVGMTRQGPSAALPHQRTGTSQ